MNLLCSIDENFVQLLFAEKGQQIQKQALLRDLVTRYY